MKKYYLIITLVLFSTVVFGQSNPPATPIDGGLGLLLASGAAWGVKRILKRSKQSGW